MGNKVGLYSIAPHDAVLLRLCFQKQRAEADVCDTAWMKTSNRNMEKEAEVEILLQHKLWRLLYKRPWVFHTDSASHGVIHIQNTDECTHSRMSFIHRSFLTHRQLLYSMQYDPVIRKHGFVALSTLKWIICDHLSGLKINSILLEFFFLSLFFFLKYEFEFSHTKPPFFRLWYTTLNTFFSHFKQVLYIYNIIF